MYRRCFVVKSSKVIITLPSYPLVTLFTYEHFGWLICSGRQVSLSTFFMLMYALSLSLSFSLSLSLSLSLSPSSQAFVPSSASFSSYVFCWGSRSTMGWSFWRFLSQMRRLGGMPVCSLKTIPSASSSSISLSVSYVVCGHILDHCSPLAVYIHVQL